MIGKTSATLDESVVRAGAGGVSISATDTSTVFAYATPFQPALDLNGADPDPTVKKHIARVSVINQIQKDTLAALTASSVNAAGDVTVTAFNGTTATVFVHSVPLEEDGDIDPTDPTAAKKVMGGFLAANIVNGSTTARVQGSTVTTTAGGDIKVEATDDSFLDATIFMNVEGKGITGNKLLKQLKGGSKSTGLMETMNIIGFTIGGGPTVNGNTLAFQKATLDALLGTEFFQDETPVAVSASIVDSAVLAAGALSVNALSKGVVNSTVSSSSKQSSDVGILKTTAKVTGAAVANNQVSRSATATIDGVSDKSVAATGALTVEATDDTRINANVKLTGSAIASTDGGLHLARALPRVRPRRHGRGYPDRHRHLDPRHHHGYRADARRRAGAAGRLWHGGRARLPEGHRQEDPGHHLA